MKSLKKKGDASYAAALIFVFAVFLVLYVLLIPEADRNELLDLDTGDTDYSKDLSRKIILEESPGRLTKNGRRDFDYDLPSLHLITTTDAKILKEINPFITKNSWFNKEPKTIEFNLNKNTTENIVLSFNVNDAKGPLSIYVNDLKIYEKELKYFNANPINIPKDNLLDGTNTLTFLPSSTGIRFWSSNRHSLENVKILADVTDISRQKTEDVFYLTDAKKDIEKATLRFIPECDNAKAGKLSITLNDELLFSGVPDCRVQNSIIVPPDYFIEGTNNLQFNTDRGNYLIDRIKISTDLRADTYPTYYFYIDSDQWEDINDADYIANLSANFIVPERDYVDMKIKINNRDIGVFQRDDEFNKIIDSYLREENNVIKLIPEDDIDVIELKIEIEKRDID